ncbi:MAG: putative beta-lysine N-acetyltransferase [Bacillota bacterium]|nr:putative beta-lysine N-acetyltransferase [Bacillota bacterium]
MNEIASTITIRENNCYLDVYMDPFNRRLRLDDYRGNMWAIIQRLEEFAHKHHVEKAIVKGRQEDLFYFLEKGFLPEAIVDKYFLGSNAYFLSKFYAIERKKSDQWIKEDGILDSINKLSLSSESIFPPKEYVLSKVDESHASELSALYDKIFPVYPTPLRDPEYVKKTIKNGTIYYAFFYKGGMISVASAEINNFYKNAELTDCATIFEHRKHGLMKFILQELEKDLRLKGIFCSYSIARAQSFGMNAVLFQLGYRYRGRFMNNCFIYEKLENMNMWVKNLASC